MRLDAESDRSGLWAWAILASDPGLASYLGAILLPTQGSKVWESHYFLTAAVGMIRHDELGTVRAQPATPLPMPTYQKRKVRKQPDSYLI